MRTSSTEVCYICIPLRTTSLTVVLQRPNYVGGIVQFVGLNPAYLVYCTEYGLH